MLRTRCLAWFGSVWWIVGSAAADSEQALTCPCPNEAGVLWRGSEKIGLREIAHLAAPILWFSPDERLLKREEISAIPTAHPCDTPSSNAVVYYQVVELVYRGNKVALPPEEDPEFIEKVEHIVLKYFLYYPEDIGLGGHTHDLEVVEMEILLEKLRRCTQVKIKTVTAQAHGADGTPTN